MVALVILVVAGQDQHFFSDEWAFVGGRRDALPLPDRYFLPHNEHWSMLPLMVYRTLEATAGIGSYWPYLGLLLLLHLGVTHVLWRLMLITGSKPIVATSAAAVFSVLGAGAENLVWAFQIGFVGSTLLGLGALYLAITGRADRRKTGVLVGLSVAGLATSGVGLAYLIAIPFVYSWRNRRHSAVVLSVPLLVYFAWYGVYERSMIAPLDGSATLPLMVVAFVIIGLASALSGYFGFEMDSVIPWFAVGVPILAGLILACRDWLAGRTLAGRTFLAMYVGAVVFFGAASVARGGVGLGSAAAPRYIYVAIALLLPGIALLISRGTDRHPRLIGAIVPLAVMISLSNASQLLTIADQTRDANNASRRVLAAASDLVRGSADIFIDQRPETGSASDVTTADLRSRHLDMALQDISPTPQDRLTASLNLQIRVAPVRGAGATSPCRNSLEQRITVPTSRWTTSTFLLSADAPVELRLHGMGLKSAPRVIDLAKGTYRIDSTRDAGELTIESNSPSSLLASC